MSIKLIGFITKIEFLEKKLFIHTLYKNQDLMHCLQSMLFYIVSQSSRKKNAYRLIIRN